MLFLLSTLALATPGFDPSEPAARFTEEHTYTADGEIKLWSAIERLEDPDRTLLVQEEFSTALEWPPNVAYAPFIRQAFGTARPGSHAALLHMGLNESIAFGTPILMVHGAGDNGSRSFVTMATRFDRRFRPVYALTFAHPHGDVFAQAELIADAIARIRERTGAEQVDIVAHSKGGISAAIYLSHHDGADWDNDAYESVGTTYRGDVRRAVFIASPLGGTDTSFRWSANNYAALDADTALTPSSWSTYYPTGTGNWWNSVDLSEQDFLAADGDLFPGQRQILARQPYTLPGANPTLGAYAVQQDWYTTYEGGLGYFSSSAGIDAVIEDGGSVIEHLHEVGVDPQVELFLLAGTSPLMSNGVDWVDEIYGDTWAEELGASADAWAEFTAELVGDSLLHQGMSQASVQGLARGELVLGEITGPSDGVVFESSATDAAALTARGAVVVQTQTLELSHLDLLYASPVTGQLLIEQAEGEDGSPWMAEFGERYAEADALGWVEEVLADDEIEPDTDEDSDVVVDTDEPSSQDTGDDEDAGLGTCGCQAAPSPALGWLSLTGLVGLLGWRRRR